MNPDPQEPDYSPAARRAKADRERDGIVAAQRARSKAKAARSAAMLDSVHEVQVPPGCLTIAHIPAPLGAPAASAQASSRDPRGEPSPRLLRTDEMRQIARDTGTRYAPDSPAEFILRMPSVPTRICDPDRNDYGAQPFADAEKCAIGSFGATRRDKIKPVRLLTGDGLGGLHAFLLLMLSSAWSAAPIPTAGAVTAPKPVTAQVTAEKSLPLPE